MIFKNHLNSSGMPSAVAGEGKRGRKMAPRVGEAKTHSIVTLKAAQPSTVSSVTAIITIGAGDIKFVRIGKPVWDEVSFTIAEAIRNHEAIAKVPLLKQLAGIGFQDPSVGEWLNRLRMDVSSIHIELLETEIQRQAAVEINNAGTKLIETGPLPRPTRSSLWFSFASGGNNWLARLI